jgi:hypothetical protein
MTVYRKVNKAEYVEAEVTLHAMETFEARDGGGQSAS